ncbi:MAG TPA: class I SAM-dependent methyltransferase [Mycobacterium sp.]|nr:class I SAM-dependent methyltransferase [Mycobacterium sp.]
MNRTPKVWRDDDIDVETTGVRLRQLLEVDDLFQHYNVPHTVAVIADGLWRNREVVAAILARRMVPQLHGWTHAKLTNSATARARLSLGVDLLTALFGQRPTVLYPPWNLSNGKVERAAAALGLTVETEKVSLDQFVRFRGGVGERTINFHFWAGEDRRRLTEALPVYAVGSAMKVTDYAPRAAAFDTYLKGAGLVGAEIGVDAGAHAEALLRYCPVAKLYLVDPWPRDYAFGYCEGRLARYRHRIAMVRKQSKDAVALFTDASLDFLYFDQAQAGTSVAYDLEHWWPRLKVGGVLGHRNYAPVNQGLMDAVDAFAAAHKLEKIVEFASDVILLKDR